MLFTAPTPFRGATTLNIYQVVFDENLSALIVRAQWGTMEDSVFVPDAALAEFVKTVQGSEYEPAIAASGLRDSFSSTILPLFFAGG